VSGSAYFANVKVTVFGSCRGKDFMLEAVDVLKGVSPAIAHFCF
jgi:hypothetical protein